MACRIGPLTVYTTLGTRHAAQARRGRDSWTSEDQGADVQGARIGPSPFVISALFCSFLLFSALFRQAGRAAEQVGQ